jgi:histidine ammonia-lyase
LIHFIRPHKGQITTASRKRISGRKWNYRAREDTQDPYSFRCIPQVHGASKMQLTQKSL